ncbi:MAG: alpha/beta hydrolase [Clostridiales Family XIII bacterium]|nr:alpha/beta hydrolase [Clostridiales Family XIII bacterium]
MKNYRMYVEPKYEEVSPEAIILPALYFNFGENAASERSRVHAESIMFLTGIWKNTNIYEDFAKVWTKNDYIERDGFHIPVRIYRKDMEKKTDEKLPVIMYIHGGAFAMNNADIYDQFYRGLAYFTNAIIVAPDYRLAPENKFPVGLKDAYKALEWTSKKVEDFGGASDNIFIAGDSSGGNFAAVISLMARDKNGPKIKGQILVYPLTIFNPKERTKSEIRYGKGYFLEYDSQVKGISYYFNDYKDSDTPYASPLLADSLKDLPKTLLIAAACDPLLDQELFYAARLDDEGNDVKVKIYEGMVHGYINQPYKETFDTYKKIKEFIEG